MSLDHVTAESEGGKYEEDNLVPACKDCNQEKGKLDLEGYRLLIWRKRPAGRIVSGIALAVTENITLFSPVEMLALRSIADRIKQDNPMPVFPGELMYRDLPYLMAVEQQGMRVSA